MGLFPASSFNNGESVRYNCNTWIVYGQQRIGKEIVYCMIKLADGDDSKNIDENEFFTDYVNQEDLIKIN
jgi:hypothetical protein